MLKSLSLVFQNSIALLGYFYLHFSTYHTPERAVVLDLLPSITTANPIIYIKEVEEEMINWAIFIHTFSTSLWIVLIFVAIIMAIILTSVERYFGSKYENYLVTHYVKNLWIASKANFGGKASSITKRNSHEMLLFTCLLAGSIIWISYRASITSELSIVEPKLPFHNLESLLKSNYK